MTTDNALDYAELGGDGDANPEVPTESSRCTLITTACIRMGTNLVTLTCGCVTCIAVTTACCMVVYYPCMWNGGGDDQCVALSLLLLFLPGLVLSTFVLEFGYAAFILWSGQELSPEPIKLEYNPSTGSTGMHSRSLTEGLCGALIGVVVLYTFTHGMNASFVRSKRVVNRLFGVEERGRDPV